MVCTGDLKHVSNTWAGHTAGAGDVIEIKFENPPLRHHTNPNTKFLVAYNWGRRVYESASVMPLKHDQHTHIIVRLRIPPPYAFLPLPVRSSVRCYRRKRQYSRPYLTISLVYRWLLHPPPWLGLLHTSRRGRKGWVQSQVFSWEYSRIFSNR